MKEITLSNNITKVLVDDEDFDLVKNYKWSLVKGTKTSYATARINGKAIYMHRWIMSPPLNMEIDHIDHNGLNNRKNNLRISDISENRRNRASWGKSSIYKGVSYNKKYKLYKMNFGSAGSPIRVVKSFKSEIAAAKEYDRLAKIHYGEYANLNFK